MSSITITIKTTKEEKDRIRELADKNNMTINSYIKNRVLVDQKQAGDFSSLTEYEKKIYKVLYRTCGLTDIIAREVTKGTGKYKKRLDEVQSTLLKEGFISNIMEDMKK